MDDTDDSVAKLRDDAAIKAMLERVCDTTGMGFAAVACVTESRWIACQVVDRIEFGLDPGDELELKTTICDEIRGHGKAVIIDRIDADHNWRTHPTPILYGFQSYIAFPIVRADGSFFGTLCAIDPQPHKLDTPEIVDLFQTLSRDIAALLG